MKPVHFNLERIMSDDAALLGKKYLLHGPFLQIFHG